MTLERLAELLRWAFDRLDEAPEALSYPPAPGLVAHVDARARATIRALYAERLAPVMRVLDLMSSRHSHLPDLAIEVRSHGMNRAQLDANPAMARRFASTFNSGTTRYVVRSRKAITSASATSRPPRCSPRATRRCGS